MTTITPTHDPLTCGICLERRRLLAKAPHHDDGRLLGTEQHADKPWHVEENGGAVTVALRAYGIARNGMSYQYLTPGSAERLAKEIQRVVSQTMAPAS